MQVSQVRERGDKEAGKVAEGTDEGTSEKNKEESALWTHEYLE